MRVGRRKEVQETPVQKDESRLQISQHTRRAPDEHLKPTRVFKRAYLNATSLSIAIDSIPIITSRQASLLRLPALF